MTRAEFERRKEILKEYERIDAEAEAAMNRGDRCACGEVEMHPTAEMLAEMKARTAEIRRWVYEMEAKIEA